MLVRAKYKFLWSARGLNLRPPSTSRVFTKSALPMCHVLLLLQISLLINTLAVVPKTTHQVKHLKKNTSAEKYIALANAETRLVDGDNYLDFAVLSYLIVKRSNYITLKHFFYVIR
jgi:hypothetical protein